MTKASLIVFYGFQILFMNACGIAENGSTTELGANQIGRSIAPEPESPVRPIASIRPVYSAFVEDQPLVFEFSIKNPSKTAIGLELGQDFKGSFHFVLTLPDKKQVRLPQYARDGISRIGSLSIRPENVYSQRVILNEWLGSLSPLPPGEYRIDGSLSDPAINRPGKGVEIVPFGVSFKIERENYRVLRKLCEELYGKIVHSTSYMEASDAALELSFVNNTVAVPYILSALASNKNVESVIINSLAKVGKETAVEALMSASTSVSEKEIKTQANSALELIAFQTQDEELKRKIHGFLKK